MKPLNDAVLDVADEDSFDDGASEKSIKLYAKGANTVLDQY
jgi:hypothetical protein